MMMVQEVKPGAVAGYNQLRYLKYHFYGNRIGERRAMR